MDEHLRTALFSASLLTFCLTAAVYDVRSYRLPNWLMASGAVVGVGCSALLGGVAGLEQALYGGLLGIALLFLPFAARAMGGGDVKFLGALGCFLGPISCAWALLYGAVAGGALSLVVYCLPGVTPPGEAKKRRKVPYGVALAVGAIVAYQLRGPHS